MMKPPNRSAVSVFLALALLAASAAPGVAATAPPSEASRQSQIDSERTALRKKIAEADHEASAIGKQLGISEARRAALQKENNALRAKLHAQQQRLAQTESQLGLAHSDLESYKSNLEVLAGRMEAMQQRLKMRQRVAYKMGGLGSYLELLVSAESFREFLVRFVFVKKAIAEDRTRFTAVQNLGRQLDQAKTELDERTRAIEAQKAKIEAERSSLASTQKAVAVNQQQVQSEISNHKGLLSKVQAEKAVYLKQMQKLEAESRSIAALLKSRQRGQVFQAGGVKKLAWPTTGPVSSSYGYRTHPVFKDRRMHAGIDISAPSGQAVISGEAGSVVFAGVKGGYGNTVIIDHGNALATLYAHLSSISVSQGAQVSRSSRVGGVGCTGYCTGPHLHFETRINGDPVNPMQFF